MIDPSHPEKSGNELSVIDPMPGGVDEPFDSTSAGGWSGRTGSLIGMLAIRCREALARHRVAVQGSLWASFSFVVNQVLRLASTLILVHQLVGPEAFGLLALVNTILTGLLMLSEIGLGNCVIQHPDGDEPFFLDTAYSIQALRGLMLWLAASVISYPFARFYHQPVLCPLMIVAALSVTARSLASMVVWTRIRQVRLGAIALLNISGDVAGLLVSVVWAVLAPSVWALVMGTLASAVVYMAGSYLLGRSWPRWQWDRRAAQAIMQFGGWVSISTALYFLASQSERLVLGKIVTAVELGCFSVALQIVTAPSGAISRLVSQVWYPIISRQVREDRSLASRAYSRVRLYFMGLSLVLAGGFILLGRPVTHWVLPPKYAMTGWLVQLLGLRAAFDIFSTPTSTVILAAGISKYSAYGNTARVVVMAAGLGLVLRWGGFHGAVWVLTLAPVATYFVALWGVRRLFPRAIVTEIASFLIFIVVCILLGLGQKLI